LARLWIEEEIGTTLDPALITNPTTELNTVADIVRVITGTQDDV
jgi:hypothetical protein